MASQTPPRNDSSHRYSNARSEPAEMVQSYPLMAENATLPKQASIRILAVSLFFGLASLAWGYGHCS
jgi:hypothetical protein